MTILSLLELLSRPQQFSAGNQRDQHKSNRDPGECLLIRSQAKREKDQSKNKKNRGGTFAKRLLFCHPVIIHKDFGVR